MEQVDDRLRARVKELEAAIRYSLEIWEAVEDMADANDAAALGRLRAALQQKAPTPRAQRAVAMERR